MRSYGQYLALRELGLEKTASRWARFFRQTANPGPVEYAMRRSAGVSPTLSGRTAQTPAEREDFIKHWRSLNKTDLPDIAPYGSPTYKRIWRDVREGRMVPLETGTTQQGARGILARGPSNRLIHDDDLTYPPEVAKQLYDAHRSGTPSGRLLSNKANYGLFAAPEGTARTRAYAERAADRQGGEPAILRFRLPRSLVFGGPDEEQLVSRQTFQRFGFNKHIV